MEIHRDILNFWQSKYTINKIYKDHQFLNWTNLPAWFYIDEDNNVIVIACPFNNHLMYHFKNIGWVEDSMALKIIKLSVLL